MGNHRTPAALVTGSRRGIGRAIAESLGSRGFDVIVNDIAEDEAEEETVTTLRKMGRRAIFIQHDVSNIAAHEAFVDRCWNAPGAIDCLVNNAGVSVRKRDDVLKSTPEEYDRLLGVNLRGPFFLTIAVAKRMIETPAAGIHRCIVNIASVGSVIASTILGPYCISKAGMSMLTQIFALRLAEYGIMVNEVRPGVTRTQMTADFSDQYDKMIAAGLHPIRRWGEPEDVAAIVAALACGTLPFVTGDCIHVAGGMQVHSLQRQSDH